MNFAHIAAVTRPNAYGPIAAVSHEGLHCIFIPHSHVQYAAGELAAVQQLLQPKRCFCGAYTDAIILWQNTIVTAKTIAKMAKLPE